MNREALLLIDASCMAYLIEGKLHEYQQHDNPDCRLAMIRWIDRRLFLASSFGVRPLWLIDSKPYWRSRYEPEYKATRHTSKRLDVSACLNAIAADCHTLGMAEFEADDLAGAIAGLGCEAYLLSTDTDWSGLVSDCVTVLSPCHEPHIRQPIHVWSWLKKKHDQLPKYKQGRWQLPRYQEFEPRDVFRFKCIFGDASDNLPEGCHPGLIDLIEPIEKPNDDIIKDALRVAMREPVVGFDLELANQFSRTLPVLPFNPISVGVEMI